MSRIATEFFFWFWLFTRLNSGPAGPLPAITERMLDPSRESTPAEDNDLEVFKGVREFKNLIFGS
ncbi:hypothetical protein XI03_12330 [Bradyrhizobium sp. CCBAU 65884]|uniref:hypothetical protein n=1 Tax=Bradyrhizobium sp. CCBAU 65884 TaxID=722477 RepID=UPI0023060B57|nr:hypothetical protein [Bradyrhizobium sp. CCBAU 65884]MDA9475264.1 hypothetical protein [Bradyrhizobium sp. CCBAU 65884]